MLLKTVKTTPKITTPPKTTPKTTEKKTTTITHPFKKKKRVTLPGIHILKRIAKGSFGKVYHGIKNGVNCAVKLVDLRDTEGDFPMEGMVTEWLSEQKIGPQFLGCWSVPNEDLGVLVSELWNGTLDDFMEKNNRKTVPKIVLDKVTSQIEKLHSLGHAHLDLHGGNILVKWDSTGKNVLDATITDFGKTHHINGIEQDKLNLPIELFKLKRTTCPKSIDRQFIQVLKNDYK